MDNNNYKNIVTVKFAQAQQPRFEERRGKGYIEFGINNDYPKYLLSLYNESPKHGAIIKGKANYIYGKGFDNEPGKANVQGETFNQILKKCILDDELYGGYYLQIIYNLLGEIKDIYHLEFHKVRTNKSQSEFKVKTDWEDTREKERTYCAFDNKYDAAEPIKILAVKQYNPRSDVYPLPSYFQALNYVESDVQVSRHILGNAKDGFVGSTLINLNGGEPQEEQKAAVEKGLKNKFTGSEGDRVVIMFNKSKDNESSIVPLGQNMLTKEDFTNVNNLIQQEIFAGHQVTSPMLFGIKTEGQLGGRSEIIDAYEIFNNTYVNERQQAHEHTFSVLITMAGKPGIYNIIPVEPLGFNLTEAGMLALLPRQYFLDKLGIDDKYYNMPSSTGVAPIVADVTVTDVIGATTVLSNDNIKNLTGRQYQNVMRIVRQFTGGKLTKEQAALMLKSGFAFTDDDVNTFLGLDNDAATFSDDEIDFAIISELSNCGESKEQFEVLSRQVAKLNFAEVVQIDQLEADILNLIQKDKRIDAETIASTLKIDVPVIVKALDNLEKNGLVASKTTKTGNDITIERTPTKVNIEGPKPSTTEILLRYSYEGPQDSRNRPFCANLMKLDRLYSRADIENASIRLGYSVWDRRGGWYTEPDGTHRPYCRHDWFALTVARKK